MLFIFSTLIVKKRIQETPNLSTDEVKKRWGGGWLTNWRPGSDHVKVSDYGPLQSPDERKR